MENKHKHNPNLNEFNKYKSDVGQCSDCEE